MTLAELKGHTLHCPDCGPAKDIAAFKVTRKGVAIHREIEHTPQGLVVKYDDTQEFDSLTCCECGYGGEVEDFLEDVYVDERGEPY